MQILPNTIVLRPRFDLELCEQKEVVLQAFAAAQKSPIIVKRLDDHLFISFKKEHTTFWTPQLHLELYQEADANPKLHGVYGPNPTLWTFFMFIHFVIGTLFIALGVWTYVNQSLEKSYGLQLAGMGLLLTVWIALYVFGRIGKKHGKPQIVQLHQFITAVLIRDNNYLHKNH